MHPLTVTPAPSSSLAASLRLDSARTLERPKRRVEILAEELRELGRDASVEQAVEIGRRVVEVLYEGDLSSWRSRGPKAHSLRTLARRCGVSLSSSALYRAVALYELSERLGGVESWTEAGLGISHMRLVLGLPRDEQRRLLDATARGSWTVAELEREATLVRARAPKPGRRGGRPRLPRFVKSIRRLRKCADNKDELLGDLDSAAQMDREKIAELRASLATVRARCDELDLALKQAWSSAADGAHGPV